MPNQGITPRPSCPVSYYCCCYTLSTAVARNSNVVALIEELETYFWSHVCMPCILSWCTHPSCNWAIHGIDSKCKKTYFWLVQHGRLPYLIFLSINSWDSSKCKNRDKDREPHEIDRPCSNWLWTLKKSILILIMSVIPQTNLGLVAMRFDFDLSVIVRLGQSDGKELGVTFCNAKWVDYTFGTNIHLCQCVLQN